MSRSLRMLGFGLLWYGPYQYYWYNLLDWAMPARNTQNFLSKVRSRAQDQGSALAAGSNAPPDPCLSPLH